MEQLVDLKTIRIDRNMKKEDRQISFINQIRNPYRFLVDGTVVNISFNGDETLEEIIIGYKRKK